MNRRSMILSAFFFYPQGDQRMSWRYPSAPSREIFTLEYDRQLAVAAETAKIDMLFVADHVVIWDSFDSTVAHYANVRLESLRLFSALAGRHKAHRSHRDRLKLLQRYWQGDYRQISQQQITPIE